MEKHDIFDRIFSLKLLSPFHPLYRKYKEPLLYLFFGGLTFFLSIGLYWLFTYPLRLTPLVANALSWIICVAFAYVTSRTRVFKEKAHDSRGIARSRHRLCWAASPRSCWKRRCSGWAYRCWASAISPSRWSPRCW